MGMVVGSSTTPTDTMGSNKSRGISKAVAVTHRLGTSSSFSATVSSSNGGSRATAVADVIPSAGTNPRTKTPTPAFQTATNVDYNWPVRGVCSGRDRTNRWTGATGSEFRIKRDPAKLLGSAVARSTQTLGVFLL